MPLAVCVRCPRWPAGRGTKTRIQHQKINTCKKATTSRSSDTREGVIFNHVRKIWRWPMRRSCTRHWQPLLSRIMCHRHPEYTPCGSADYTPRGLRVARSQLGLQSRLHQYHSVSQCTNTTITSGGVCEAVVGGRPGTTRAWAQVCVSVCERTGFVTERRSRQGAGPLDLWYTQDGVGGCVAAGGAHRATGGAGRASCYCQRHGEHWRAGYGGGSAVPCDRSKGCGSGDDDDRAHALRGASGRVARLPTAWCHGASP